MMLTIEASHTTGNYMTVQVTKTPIKHEVPTTSLPLTGLENTE